ncbi:hypothetical protein ACFX13_019425 [Malus domestica]
MGELRLPHCIVLPNQSMTGANYTLFSKNGKFSVVNASKVQQANGESFIASDFGLNRSQKLMIDDDGNFRIYSYDPSLRQWNIIWQAGYELCKVHGMCGLNAICVSDGSSSSYCVCPSRFRGSAGGIKDGGCERKIKLTNLGNTKFERLDYVNFTGGSNQSNWPAVNFNICESRCLGRNDCLRFMFKYDGKGYCVLQLERLLYGDDGAAGDDVSRSDKPPASAGGFERDDKEHCDYMHPFRGGANFPFRHAEEKREGGGRG